MGRIPLIVGNWKMHKTVIEAESFIQALLPRLAGVNNCEVAVCPAFTALAAVVDSARGSAVEVYAQNMHELRAGAYTGEVSPLMLADLDVTGVILGHSERRAYFGESDTALKVKLVSAFEVGLAPILCIGETQKEYEAGVKEAKLRAQLAAGLADLTAAQIGQLTIAYEPIWAIGTGLVATAEQAQTAAALIRSVVRERAGAQAEQTRILYGGSVKPDNASELLALPDIDGALVGGASLEADTFAAIIESVAS